VPQRFYYHASPPQFRRSIRSSGLIPGTTASYGPPAVYLFRNELFAANYRTDVPMDVWQVDAHGLRLYPDPEDPSAAVYAPQPIGPERLRFIGMFLDGELE